MKFWGIEYNICNNYVNYICVDIQIEIIKNILEFLK